jgi:hypothetical protein
LVDGIPFKLPVEGRDSPALMVVYSIDAKKARALLPGNEIYPFRLWRRGLLVITVIDYRITSIGSYIEFSIAIACTHGSNWAPPLIPALLMNYYGTGQYVYDLPVSTEISVKGGKGIWGMPKHQANLDFLIQDDTVSSQYDLDGQMVMRIDVERPKRAWLPLNMGAVNYCQFRGMLMKSQIYFSAKMGFSLFKTGSARLTIGDHPRAQPLKDLDISPEPLFASFIPAVRGVLDDHVDSWFLSDEQLPRQQPEGLASVVNLGLGREWLPPPHRTDEPQEELG